MAHVKSDKVQNCASIAASCAFQCLLLQLSRTLHRSRCLRNRIWGLSNVSRKASLVNRSRPSHSQQRTYCRVSRGRLKRNPSLRTTVECASSSGEERERDVAGTRHNATGRLRAMSMVLCSESANVFECFPYSSPWRHNLRSSESQETEQHRY